MEYYVSEEPVDTTGKHNARSKARQDIEKIFSSEGIKPIMVPSFPGDRSVLSGIKKIRAHQMVVKSWRSACASLREGDTLYIQFPVVNHTIYFGSIVEELTGRGIQVILVVHDLDYFRLVENIPITARWRITREEVDALKKCSCAIVHNNAMRSLLLKKGILAFDKTVVLGLFDYLLPSEPSVYGNRGIGLPVAVAGNLSRNKAGYLYSLPDNQRFALYGAGSDENFPSNVEYRGKFSPDSIPQDFDASFGLVWDGDSAQTCSGEYGRYLRINNPHKASLYLSIGLPLLVWDESALAKFVIENDVGTTINSLDDINGLLSSMPPSDYSRYCSNAAAISTRLRAGAYTRSALSKVRAKYRQCGREMNGEPIG